MKAGWMRFAATAPAVLYAQMKLLGAPMPLTAVVVGTALTCALPLLIVIPRLRTSRRLLLLVALAAAAGIGVGWAISPQEAIVGMVLGSPVSLLAWLYVSRSSLIAALFNFPLSVATGLFDLAVVRGLPAQIPGLSLPVEVWRASIASVAAAELRALAAGPGGAAPQAAPLSMTGDVVFDALAWLALAGSLLSMLVLSERALRLPTSAGDLARERSIRRHGVGRRGRFRAPIPAPSRPSRIPESAYLFSGVAALSVTAVVETAFGVATFLSYGMAMLSMAVGVLVVFVGLAATTLSRVRPRRGVPTSATQRVANSAGRSRPGAPSSRP